MIPSKTRQTQRTRSAPPVFQRQMTSQTSLFEPIQRTFQKEFESLIRDLSPKRLNAFVQSVSWTAENQMIFAKAIREGKFGSSTKTLKCLAQNIGNIEWTNHLAKIELFQSLNSDTELVRSNAIDFEVPEFDVQTDSSEETEESLGVFGNDREVLLEIAISLSKINLEDNLGKIFLIPVLLNLTSCCEEAIDSLVPLLENTDWNAGQYPDLVDGEDYQPELFLLLIDKFYTHHKDVVAKIFDKMIWTHSNQEFLISTIKFNSSLKNKEKMNFVIQHVLSKMNLDSQRLQDLLLDHLNNMDSIFTAILDSPDFGTTEDRMNTLNLLCGLLKTQDIKIPVDPFVDALFKNSEIFGNILFEDEKVIEICSFLKNLIENKYLDQKKDDFIISDVKFSQYLSCFFFIAPLICKKYQNIFNQVKFYLSKEILIESESTIGRNYLQLIEFFCSKPFLKNVFENILACDDVNDFIHNYSALLSPNKETLIILHQGYFSDILNRKEPRSGFNSIYLFKKNDAGEFQNESLDHIPMRSLVSEFPLLKSVYEAIQSANYPIKFLKSLELGDYETLFLKAMNGKKLGSREKLKNSHDSNLAKIFGKFLTDSDKILGAIDEESRNFSVLDIKVTDAFVEKICSAYDFQSKTEPEKSDFLILISSIFARLSSSHYFGTEYSSPVPLRNMSLALLNKSVELNSEVISKEQFEHWKNILTGNRGAFSCTAILSNKMLDILKQKPEIYSFFPVEWK